MRRPAEIAVGLALTKALDLLGGDRHAAPAMRASSPSPPSVERGPLLALTVASFAIGLALMLPFHAPVTRILGVAALFTFIVSGVFLIADPSFLGSEDDAPSSAEPEQGYRAAGSRR